MSVRVKGYSYKRKGKTVKVTGYTRRKALKSGRRARKPSCAHKYRRKGGCPKRYPQRFHYAKGKHVCCRKKRRRRRK